jgi:hypothetical protein
MPWPLCSGHSPPDIPWPQPAPASAVTALVDRSLALEERRGAVRSRATFRGSSSAQIMCWQRLTVAHARGVLSFQRTPARGFLLISLDFSSSVWHLPDNLLTRDGRRAICSHISGGL